MLPFLTSRLGIAGIAVIALSALGWMLKLSWQNEAIANQKVDAALAALNSEKVLRERADAALVERERTKSRLALEINQLKNQLRAKEDSDEILRVWSNTRLPDVVVNQLREFTGSTNRRENMSAGGDVNGMPLTHILR